MKKGSNEYRKFFDELKTIIKKNNVIDICPRCNKFTKYRPNPYYHHVCEHCKESYGESELTQKYPHEFVYELLEKYGLVI